MIIDTPDNVTYKLTALKAAGVTTIIRYLNPLGRSTKVVSPAEASAIKAAGLRMGLVSEGWGDFAHAGINAEAGTRDAKNAFAYAPTVGATRGGATIYFAVDTDASDVQIHNEVLPYFRAISDYNNSHENGEWSVGIYACGAACTAVAAEKLVSMTWLPNAVGWNGSRAYLAGGLWNLRQHLPTHLQGVDVDVNDAGRDGQIGDFVPFGAPTQPSIVEVTYPGLKPLTDVQPPGDPLVAPPSTVNLENLVETTIRYFGGQYIENHLTGVASVFKGHVGEMIANLSPDLAKAIVAAILAKGKFVSS